MLKNLRIRNFKCWEDTGEIRMAPITLFFGTNSSGKSSIGQFLMMLKQTKEWPDRKTVLYPGNGDSAVNLGSFPDMVLHHDLNRKIEFSYDWMLGGKSVQQSFSAVIAAKNTNPPAIMLGKFEYSTKDHANDISNFYGMRHKPGSTAEYEVFASFHLNNPPEESIGVPVKFYGFSDEAGAHYREISFETGMLEHEYLFSTISYLGPLRTKTERLYSWAGGEPGDVGYAGNSTIPAILAARERMLVFRHGKQEEPFHAVIAASLKKIGLIEDFKVNRISEQRYEYEVKVQTKGSRDWVDIPDAGFGVSQVLPVLVQCFYARPNSIVIMEQPEIHLHPGAQSALADVMIDAVRSKENGRDRNIQLIIETHSEHFLRRLQRRIAEGAIDRDMVSCYYADASRTPAKLEQLDVDSFGNIRNWPENFFGDEMGDITAQSKAALERRKKKSSGTTQ